MAASTSAVAAARRQRGPGRDLGAGPRSGGAGPRSLPCRRAATPTAWWRWMGCSTWSGATGRPAASSPMTRPATWSTGAEMPVQRNHLAAAAAGGRVWAIGGRAAASVRGSRRHLRPDHQHWSSGPLLEATSAASEGVLGSVIVISGGEAPGQNGRMVDAHWQLDTAAGTNAQWRPLASPPLAVHGAPGQSWTGTS